MKQTIQGVIATAVLLLGSWNALAQTIDNNWTIVVGSDDPLQRVAADDLKKMIQERDGVALNGPVVASEFKGNGQAIIVGTAPFAEGTSNEAYHLQAKDGSLHITGPTSKGAMNGVYRFFDRRSLDITGLDEQKSPAFHHRVGNHKMNQSPPAGYTDEDAARYFATHYINVVWGEKHGPPMPLAARQKYGLGLMVEMKFPPFIDGKRDWMNDPANAAVVYFHEPGKDRRVADPFDPLGRKLYLKSYEQLLNTNPDTTILYAIFGDYSVIPSPASRRVSDGKAYGHTRIETMKEIMGIMREAIAKSPAKDATAIAWLWHGFFGEAPEAEQQFMEWLRDNGYGSLYNEAGNNDNWLIKRDNFNQTALKSNDKGRSLWGENYYPLVSVGGACESVNPVIGMPLPAVAGHKLKRLIDSGVNNVVLWWGSAEGWVYQPNIEVMSAMTWEPQAYKDEKDPLDPAKPDALMEKVAAKDFGAENAKDVLAYWNAFDKALVTEGPLYKAVTDQAPPDQDGLHINDWYQRMGIFTETVFSQEFARPLTIDSLIDHKAAKKGTYWGTSDQNLANYKIVCQRLGEAQAMLATFKDRPTLSPTAKQYAQQMYDWSQLYVTLLNSQKNYYRALRAVHGHEGETVQPDQREARIKPVMDDEQANIKALIAVLERLPANANIRQPHEGVVNNRGSTRQEIASLREKSTAMRFAEENLPNLALRRPATASSAKTQDGTTYVASFATDGNMETRWSSKLNSNDEWLAVDLGQTRSIEFVKITWKDAYPAAYDIEVADSGSPDQWRSVFHGSAASAGVSVISLPAPAAGQHVRLHASKPATDWGYSVREFEVYGK